MNKKKAKQVQISTPTTTSKKNLNFTIFQLLKQGLNPAKICHTLSLQKTTIQYYLSSLKEQGYIKKVGYGTWEIRKELTQTSSKIRTKVTTINPLKNHKNLNLFERSKPNQVRGHAFMFNLKLPKIRNWTKENREKVLSKSKITYRNINIKQTTQAFTFRNHKIWLSNHSITVFWPAFKGILTDTAAEARKYIIYEFKTLVRGLENLTGANFQIHKQYIFKVCRQHYSLIKNALAMQYNKEGKKLQVYNETGLWFAIDNSFNLHEAETLHPKTAHTDMKPVQDFFNGLKETKGYTPQFVINAFGHLSAAQLHEANKWGAYAQHIESHTKAIIQLSKGIEEFNKKISKLGDK